MEHRHQSAARTVTGPPARRFIWCGGLLLAFVLLGLLVPWRPLIGGRLETMLGNALGQPVKLELKSIGFDNMVLSQVAIGSEEPLVLQHVGLDYHWRDLWEGRLNGLTLNGLPIVLSQTPSGWLVSGLAQNGSGGGKTEAFPLPITAAQVAAIPLSRGSLEKSSLTVTAPDMQLVLPLTMRWEKQPVASLHYSGTGLVLAAPGLDAATGDVSLTLTHDPAQENWQGAWTMQALTLKGLGDFLPVLQGKGQLRVSATEIKADGQFTSADRQWRIRFLLTLPLGGGAARLTLQEAVMPWQGGTIALQPFSITLGKKRDIDLTIAVKSVQLGQLLRQLTGERASGTGSVSGTLPLTYKADGVLLIRDGALQADAPGAIAIQPEVIPGDNPQVGLVRDILRDLHYQVLSFAVTGTPEGKLKVKLAVSGGNPAVYSGKPVNLNVNLTGDVLDFIQHNLLSFTDPAKLLSRDDHAKP